MKFSALKEYSEEEIWVLGFPHHAQMLEKSLKSRVENELFGRFFWHECCGKLNTHILDLNAQKTCQMTA